MSSLARLSVTTAVLVSLFPLIATTQTTQPATIKVTTRIVVLDVVVTDKKGNLIHHDLTADDFTILEDKQTQTIRSFEPPSQHQLPASDKAVVNSAADLKKIGDAPVTLLVLDELNSRFEDMSFSRQMMIKYLEAQAPILKQPTAMMIATNSTFQQVHDYTQNRDELIEVVKKRMPEYPWRMMNSGRSGPGSVERMAQVMAALQQIAQASSGTPGRKNLIWVGNGFPSANLVGMEQQQADTLEAAMRHCTARLLAARITMYSINPTAGSTSVIEVDTPDDLNTSLDENGSDPFGGGLVSFTNFAPSTGGIAFTGRNDLNNVIAESVAKGQDYFTLSYSPSNTSDDPAKFRRIRIVMKDPTLRATTRDGYYPETSSDINPVLDKSISTKQVVANLQLDLSAALTTTISYNGLTVAATKSENVYQIHVAESGLRWSDPAPDGSQHAEATVAAGWYDSKGKLLGHVIREETFPRGDSNSGANFTLPITLANNIVRLRFVVRDAFSGHMGTADVTKF
ncbi:MAG TPA: VWA domain-containing protein [Edaphobacter sp.]|jgi:VWFA-related protein|nr:VWA domain-containing protein [Edaphobacter sp.]